MQFTVWSQRNCINQRETCRDHIIRQHLCQFAAQRVAVDILNARLQHQISVQTQVAALIHTINHHRCLDAGVMIQLMLNFQRLNAVASNLDLLVNTTEEMHAAVWQIATFVSREIAGIAINVRQGIATERTVFQRVQIAFRQIRRANHNFPDFADFCQFARFVQNQ